MKKSPTAALHAAVNTIPKGQMTRVAKDADIALTVLLRLRRGDKLDIRISTLAKLAHGMGMSADELLGLTTPDPSVAIAGRVVVSEAAASKVRREVERIASDVARLQASLTPPEVSRPKKQRP